MLTYMLIPSFSRIAADGDLRPGCTLSFEVSIEAGVVAGTFISCFSESGSMVISFNLCVL